MISEAVGGLWMRMETRSLNCAREGEGRSFCKLRSFSPGDGLQDENMKARLRALA